MEFKQEHRRIGINTPLGEDVLLLTHVEGTEELSRLWAFQIRMLSEREDIAPQELVGQNVTIVMLDPEDEPNYINGYVRQFVNQGRGDRASIYTAEIVPWLWVLTRRSDCRIFQDKTAVQVIEEVFQAAGFSDYRLNLKGSFAKREYCVQYRETDYDFVARLMEEEGIFYFFAHEGGKHTLVLGDDPGAYIECKDDQARFMGPLSFDEVDDNLTAWEHRYEFRSGRVALADFNFEQPDGPIPAKERTLLDLPGMTDLELYDYPGRYTESGAGSSLARRRMEAEEVDYDRVLGRSKCRSYRPGCKFTVEEHHVAAEKGQVYVLTRVHHSVSAGGVRAGRRGARGLRERVPGDPGGDAVSPGADHAEGGGARTADGAGGGSERRGDLHRQARAGEGEVPLGPGGGDRRHGVVLGAGDAGLGRQGLGRDVHPADRARGDHRLPGG
jgi:type VI secretion system secreted protein VgrG